LLLALLSGQAAACPDHAPFEFGLLPGDANEHVITSGGIRQRR
jgi:hypothetical protein